MARTATQTANILSGLYDETFSSDSYEPFRISWSNLRGIAGVTKLTPGYLRRISQALNETGYTLIPMDNFLLVTQESDLSHFRLVPPRIVEQYLYEEEDDLEFDEDEDDLEDPNEDVVDYGDEDTELDGEDAKSQKRV